MATSHDFPSRVNSAATTASGDILITAVLSAATVNIDGTDVVFSAAIDLPSPIPCSTLVAPVGTVAYVNKDPGDWGPLSIGAGLIAWYDFSDTSTITDVAGVVSAAADKSPNGYDLAGATNVGVVPTTNATTINGLNVMDFTNKSYLDLGAESMTVYNGVTDGNLLVAWVSRLNTTTTMQASSLVSMNKGIGNDWQVDSRHGGGGTPTVFQGAINGTGSPMTANGDHPDWSVWTAVFDFTQIRTATSNKYLYVNGTIIPLPGGLSTTNKMVDGQQLRINSSRDIMSWPKTSHGEMIISFDINMQLAAEGYLAHKWGLASSLSPGHPFKNRTPTV